MSFKTQFVFLFCLICFSSNCIAQNIKLKGITKIDLVESAPFWNSGAYRHSEIIFENNKWNCYQDGLVEDRVDQRALKSPEKKVIITHIRDSVRKFLKPVSVKDLKQLLGYINKPDTVLKLKQFNVSTKQLAQWIDTMQMDAKSMLKSVYEKRDSIKSNLTAEQKAYFFKTIKSKQAVEDAALKALHPFFDDDRSYYGMIFTYKDNHKDTVSAYVNNFHPYHLPWKIKNKQSYNPKLSELFEYLIGNEEYAVKERKEFAAVIDWELFNRWIFTKTLWDEYKHYQLSNYNTLSTTLKPAYNYSERSGYLQSSLLPFNIQLRFDFAFADTLKTDEYNVSEKEITALYHKGNFLFDYFKNHPTYIALVSNILPKTLEQVKLAYPQAAKFDYREIKHIGLAVNLYRGWDINKSAGWLLLPNGNVILLSCSDLLIKDGDKIFADLASKPKDKQTYYCIVYDRHGHKIGGGDSLVKIEVNNTR